MPKLSATCSMLGVWPSNNNCNRLIKSSKDNKPFCAFWVSKAFWHWYQKVMKKEDKLIPDITEDLDNDINVDNDDTDEDQFPNYIDFDDDEDGVNTIDELMPTEYVINTNNGEEEPTLAVNEYEINRDTIDGVITINTVTIADSNEDGIPDYLDETISVNYNASDS